MGCFTRRLNRAKPRQIVVVWRGVPLYASNISNLSLIPALTKVPQCLLLV